ncbi:hypothetical protein ACQEVC_45465 [Plantactinospora sp. CA-294935]|uniref:hypothetical protein n=1 Tax=Plantactinospora sp. CA-294935 TaxID=3240012 RepID=UPI003D8FB8B1
MRREIRRAAAELLRDRPPQGAPASWMEQATVVAVAPGAASDGNALLTVEWRGAEVDAAYGAKYTPTVGDTVLVVVQPPSLLVVDQVIGTP